MLFYLLWKTSSLPILLWVDSLIPVYRKTCLSITICQQRGMNRLLPMDKTLTILFGSLSIITILWTVSLSTILSGSLTRPHPLCPRSSGHLRLLKVNCTNMFPIPCQNCTGPIYCSGSQRNLFSASLLSFMQLSSSLTPTCVKESGMPL